MTPLLLGVKEVAAALGVSGWTVRKLIDGGQLPTVKLPSVRYDGEHGKRTLVSVADLERFIAQHRTGGPA